MQHVPNFSPEVYKYSCCLSVLPSQCDFDKYWSYPGLQKHLDCLLFCCQVDAGRQMTRRTKKGLITQEQSLGFKHVWSEIFPRISKHNVVKFAKSVPLYSPVVQIVISGKSFSISFPLAVTKRWANGECLKQAVHLALGCTCPFSAPAGPCPQLARPLSADSPRWQTPAEQSQALCGTVWDVGIVFDVFGTI